VRSFFVVYESVGLASGTRAFGQPDGTPLQVLSSRKAGTGSPATTLCASISNCSNDRVRPANRRFRRSHCWQRTCWAIVIPPCPSKWPGCPRLTTTLLLCLTPQPFQPKLRLSRHMVVKPHRLRTCALLLGIIFLAAQFHFCADLNSGPGGPHPCQLCSTASSAVATHTLTLAIVPVVGRLEVFAKALSPSVEASRATSPRAPPSL